MLLKKSENNYSCKFQENKFRYEIEIENGKIARIQVSWWCEHNEAIQKKEEPYELYDILEKLLKNDIKNYCELVSKLNQDEPYYRIGIRKIEEEKKRIEKSLVHINDFLKKKEEDS